MEGLSSYLRGYRRGFVLYKLSPPKYVSEYNYEDAGIRVSAGFVPICYWCKGIAYPARRPDPGRHDG